MTEMLGKEGQKDMSGDSEERSRAFGCYRGGVEDRVLQCILDS